MKSLPSLPSDVSIATSASQATHKLRDYQEAAVNAVLKKWDETDRLLGVAPTGSGKAQPIDELVATPRGWQRINELEAGDFVFGSDGCPVKVLGIFPQGRKE